MGGLGWAVGATRGRQPGGLGRLAKEHSQPGTPPWIEPPSWHKSHTLPGRSNRHRVRPGGHRPERRFRALEEHAYLPNPPPRHRRASDGARRDDHGRHPRRWPDAAHDPGDSAASCLALRGGSVRRLHQPRPHAARFPLGQLRRRAALPACAMGPRLQRRNGPLVPATALLGRSGSARVSLSVEGQTLTLLAGGLLRYREKPTLNVKTRFSSVSGPATGKAKSRAIGAGPMAGTVTRKPRPGATR